MALKTIPDSTTSGYPDTLLEPTSSVPVLPYKIVVSELDNEVKKQDIDYKTGYETTEQAR